MVMVSYKIRAVIFLSKKEKKRAVISYGREQTNEWSPFKYSMFGESRDNQNGIRNLFL